MMQRCIEHDYCAPCFYMITVVTEPRRECLGEVVEPVAGAAAGIEDREQALLPEPNRAAAPAGSVPAAAPAAGLWQPGFQDSILLRRGPSADARALCLSAAASNHYP